MLTLLRLRRALFLRQIDVENATGIPVCRLSAAERGLITLNEAEYAIVSRYLHDRLESSAQLDMSLKDGARGAYGRRIGAGKRNTEAPALLFDL